MIENQPKHCPFNHTNCLADRCALWVELTTHTQGPIPEVQNKTVLGMCVFIANLQATVASVNKPPVIVGAGPMGRRVVGG